MSLNSVKGVDLKNIVNFLESFASVSLAEKWDNTGLLVEPITPRPIKCVMLTNDLTENVVKEALDVEAGLIVSYHPPIFKGLNRITKNSWKERIIGTCLENKIAIYSPHTSWDSVPGGVNDWLAGAFDYSSIRPIEENNSVNVLNAGAGRFCVLKQEIKLCEAIQLVKKLTSLLQLNVAIAKDASLETKIRSVAICAGSGSSVLMNAKADLFLTGEMSHHTLLDAIHNSTNVILCNHSNSERGFLKDFSKKLEAQYSAAEMKVHLSKEDRDPLQII
ncbi:hypothetical protein RUM44_009243 [Polyplax serrata]|uniref:NIF3-like protein 1 n=1 Tax=Polyplax serrata TaxID=468196 RepID=A0ABR1ASS1_POLSC